LGAPQVKLTDAIAALATLDPEATIYAAEPWHPDATALIIREPADGRLPEAAERAKMTYFLEVRLAQDVADDWLRLKGASHDVLALCERLIGYAKNDA
jgi:hypothetical protein